MRKNGQNRREFLKGAAIAGLALGPIEAASAQVAEPEASGTSAQDLRAYGERSRFVNAIRLTNSLDTGPGSLSTPLQDSLGYITPSSLHYVVTRFRNAPPDIDPRQHRLLIHGLVNRPLVFSVEELKRLPSVSRVHFVECAGNTAPNQRRNAQTVQQTHGWTSCSLWTGVLLSVLLKEAGLKSDASWFVAESADAGKHSKSIPLAKAPDVIIAYGQNGEPVRPDQGFPLRLVVPGWEGVSNVKWLRRIKVVDQPYMTQSESTGYVGLWPKLNGKARWFQFEMGPKSVITFPSGGHRLSGSGYYEISGLAWSGGGSVARVEVSTDEGRSWQDAKLQEPVHRIAHTRFTLGWNWDGRAAVLQSRCTDDQNNVQPSLLDLSRAWGVDTDYWPSTPNRINHFNAIQSWKVSLEGNVTNAMFS
jgi:sulfane dehydrogenase subunit SoxC